MRILGLIDIYRGRVRYPAGTECEIDDARGERLIALGQAVRALPPVAPAVPPVVATRYSPSPAGGPPGDEDE